jgi:hypothetical protein
MNNKPILILLIVLSLTPALVGCEVPELSFEDTPRVTGGNGPESNFVPPQAVIRTKVREPLLIESRHVSEDSKLDQVTLFVNGQPVRAEQTADQVNFPQYLARLQVIGWPPQSEAAEFFIFPFSPCERVADMGRARSRNPVELVYPSSTWSLCYLWVGQTPGTYDFSLQATDRNGTEGERITQRIEVQ